MVKVCHVDTCLHSNQPLARHTNVTSSLISFADCMNLQQSFFFFLFICQHFALTLYLWKVKFLSFFYIFIFIIIFNYLHLEQYSSYAAPLVFVESMSCSFSER